MLIHGTCLRTARSPGQIAEMADHAATLRQSQLRQLFSVWVPRTFACGCPAHMWVPRTFVKALSERPLHRKRPRLRYGLSLLECSWQASRLEGDRKLGVTAGTPYGMLATAGGRITNGAWKLACKPSRSPEVPHTGSMQMLWCARPTT